MSRVRQPGTAIIPASDGTASPQRLAGPQVDRDELALALAERYVRENRQVIVFRSTVMKVDPIEQRQLVNTYLLGHVEPIESQIPKRPFADVVFGLLASGIADSEESTVEFITSTSPTGRSTSAKVAAWLSCGAASSPPSKRASKAASSSATKTAGSEPRR